MPVSGRGGAWGQCDGAFSGKCSGGGADSGGLVLWSFKKENGESACKGDGDLPFGLSEFFSCASFGGDSSLRKRNLRQYDYRRFGNGGQRFRLYSGRNAAGDSGRLFPRLSVDALYAIVHSAGDSFPDYRGGALSAAP